MAFGGLMVGLTGLAALVGTLGTSRGGDAAGLDDVHTRAAVAAFRALARRTVVRLGGLVGLGAGRAGVHDFSSSVFDV